MALGKTAFHGTVNDLIKFFARLDFSNLEMKDEHEQCYIFEALVTPPCVSQNPTTRLITWLRNSRSRKTQQMKMWNELRLCCFLLSFGNQNGYPLCIFFSVYNGDVPRKYHGRWIERTYTNWINKTRKHHGGVQRKTQTQVLFFSFERLVSLNVWLWRELFSNWLWLNPFNADLQIRICRYWCSVNINSTQTMFLYPKFLP